MAVQDVREDAAERPADEQQVEKDEEEEDDAGARRDQAVGDGAEAVAFVPHRHDDRAVVRRPAEKRYADCKPDERGEPTPQSSRGDCTHNRAGGGDGLEVVPEQDVATGRHKVHAVGVHPGRRHLVRISLDDVLIYLAGILRVAKVADQ